jgi:two-component system nitrogen regulation response regulator GlnG
MPVLLVIDDERAILECFRHAFPTPEVTLLTAPSAAEGLKLFSQAPPDVAIVDVHLPDLSGLELVRRLREMDARVPIILMTGHGTAATAIEAMRLGAHDYILKPLDLDNLETLVNQAFGISRLMRVPARVAEAGETDDGSDILVGRCRATQEVYKAIGRVAPQDVNVLIRGESGTGKELVARAIYHYSRRSSGPFLAINCAAIPETLVESELFGHEKGAFTGAERKRIGKFEQCHGGTLFLDEIGDMTPATQARILRVLQDQRFERVGGNETVQTDVRLIAATHQDLERLVAEGRFRGDLYYRLNVCVIPLPPLRERGEDLPLLVEHFLRRFSRKMGKEVQRVAPEALELLRGYSWPGNVRELQSVLEQALLRATGPVLVPDFLPSPLQKPENPPSAVGVAGQADQVDLTRFIQQRLDKGTTDLHAEVLGLVERRLLVQVLQHTQDNLSEAARILGIGRSTLRARLAALGLTLSRSTSLQEGPASSES